MTAGLRGLPSLTAFGIGKTAPAGKPKARKKAVLVCLSVFGHQFVVRRRRWESAAVLLQRGSLTVKFASLLIFAYYAWEICDNHPDGHFLFWGIVCAGNPTYRLAAGATTC